MKYTIDISSETLEALKSILVQIEPTQLIVNPISKPKKLSKTEQSLQDMRDYRANKASRKR